MGYVSGGEARVSGCIFCELPKAPDPRESLVLSADPTSVTLLNRFPYNSGHLMVAPRRHTADLGVLTAEEYGALMEAVRTAAAILQRAFGPDAMNIGLNLGREAGAGVADHLHWHLVPRWNGDTNFMPVIADVKVIPQDLGTTWDRLRPHFS
jgi:ATP adenylyltransferase